MKSTIWKIALVELLTVTLMIDSCWARGFGGGGFRGGGGFHAGGGGFHPAGAGAFRGGSGGFHGGAGGGFSGGRLPGGGGLSGSGFRPSIGANPSFGNRSSIAGRPDLAGNAGLNRSNLVHSPNFGAGGLNGASRPQLGGLTPGARPQLGNGITRSDFAGNRGGFRPSTEGRPGLPGGTSLRPGNWNGSSNRFAGGTATLPGLGPSRPGAGGAGERNPALAGGGVRPGAGGAGERWNSGSIADRHQDLNNRFNDLHNHWGDAGWHHNQWVGPNGGSLNHFGYWGPNGYWGHTGAWGPNGGYWGHTGHVGPYGGWGRAGYFGPAGHWSRNWGWYNGYSPAWGYGRWNYLWNQYPVALAFGATMWGLNAVAYNFGVGSYWNPYYDAPVYYDNQVIATYSQPVVGDPAYEQPLTDPGAAVTDPSATAAPAPGDVPPAPSAAPDPLTQTFDQARAAFLNEQFDDALNLTNQALAQAPRDAAINEFRSLCLFSLGKYRESAATIHAVLAAGPGWDWTTMISLYSHPETYTNQLRELEAAEKANSNAADLRFLLAYHYLTCNHKDAAVNLLKRVTQLEPKDQLAADLVRMYAPESEDEPKPGNPPDLEQPAYPLEKLRGDWVAKDDTGEFSLKLGDNDEFAWKFTRDGKPQSISGAYTVRGNNLVMQPDSGGTMLSEITLKNDRTLTFDPIGEAHRLTFTR